MNNERDYGEMIKLSSKILVLCVHDFEMLALKPMNECVCSQTTRLKHG